VFTWATRPGRTRCRFDLCPWTSISQPTTSQGAKLKRGVDSSLLNLPFYQTKPRFLNHLFHPTKAHFLNHPFCLPKPHPANLPSLPIGGHFHHNHLPFRTRRHHSPSHSGCQPFTP